MMVQRRTEVVLGVFSPPIMTKKDGSLSLLLSSLRSFMKQVVLVAVIIVVVGSCVQQQQVHGFKIPSSSSSTTTTTSFTTTNVIGLYQQQQQHHHHHPRLPLSTATQNIYRGGSSSLASSSTSSSSSPANNDNNKKTNKLLFVQWVGDTTNQRLSRSVCATIGCMVSWIIANTTPYTIVQSASITGLLSIALSVILTQVNGSNNINHNNNNSNPYIPYTVATFCGALAGMSGNIFQSSGITAASSSIQSLSSLSPTSLGLLLLYPISVGYAFGVWDEQKWGVGKGGRLGTIAFGGNVLYSTILIPLIHQLLSILRMSTTTSAAAAAATTSILKSFVPASTKQLYSSLPIFTSLALSTVLLRQSRVKAASTTTTTTTATDQQQEQSIYKALLFSTMTIPLLMQQYNGGSFMKFVLDYCGTVLSVYTASQIVQKFMSNKRFGPIYPTAMVGWIGSILFAPNSVISTWINTTIGLNTFITPPKLFLGALMGLTSIPNFTTTKLVVSSTVASVLFHLNLLPGFGGRLGCLAYLGIVFGM